MNLSDYKNCLVQYQGGGYDGCYWEWNFFYIDREENFHDVFSSGCGGCNTEKRAIELLDENKKSSSLFIYNLDIFNDSKDFSESANPHNVKMVLQWFNENDIDFYCFCSECGQVTVGFEQMCFDSEEQAEKVLCEDCYSNGFCNCCESYVGEKAFDFEIDRENETTISVLESLLEEYGNICKNCFEHNLEQEKIQQQKDTFGKSLLTGEPDMFSEELRDYWEK